MKIKTHIKGGATNTGGYELGSANHNETLVRGKVSKGLKVRTSIKAGTGWNHNETLVRGKVSKGLKVKTSIKAGTGYNHNETLVGE